MPDICSLHALHVALVCSSLSLQDVVNLRATCRQLRGHAEHCYHQTIGSFDLDLASGNDNISGGSARSKHVFAVTSPPNEVSRKGLKPTRELIALINSNVLETLAFAPSMVVNKKVSGYFQILIKNAPNLKTLVVARKPPATHPKNWLDSLTLLEPGPKMNATSMWLFASHSPNLDMAKEYVDQGRGINSLRLFGKNANAASMKIFFHGPTLRQVAQVKKLALHDYDANAFGKFFVLSNLEEVELHHCAGGATVFGNMVNLRQDLEDDNLNARWIVSASPNPNVRMFAYTYPDKKGWKARPSAFDDLEYRQLEAFCANTPNLEDLHIETCCPIVHPAYPAMFVQVNGARLRNLCLIFCNDRPTIDNLVSMLKHCTELVGLGLPWHIAAKLFTRNATSVDDVTTQSHRIKEMVSSNCPKLENLVILAPVPKSERSTHDFSEPKYARVASLVVPGESKLRTVSVMVRSVAIRLQTVEKEERVVGTAHHYRIGPQGALTRITRVTDAEREVFRKLGASHERKMTDFVQTRTGRTF